MILFIIIQVFFFLAVLFIILTAISSKIDSKNTRWRRLPSDRTENLSVIWVVSAAISTGFGCAACGLVPAAYAPVSEPDYLVVKYHTETDTALKTDTIEEIKDWNRKLNKWNNYFFRFSIEDRSYYIIDLDAYINRFINKEDTQ